MGKHSKNPYTKQLREEASKRGAFYTTGIELSKGHRIMENTITNIWTKDQTRMISFEEHEDGGLRCDDSITVKEALRMLGYEESTEVSEDSVSVREIPVRKAVMTRAIIKGLSGLDLAQYGDEDSHSRLSAICYTIYQPRYGWTLGACKALASRIEYLLTSNKQSKETSDA